MEAPKRTDSLKLLLLNASMSLNAMAPSLRDGTLFSPAPGVYHDMVIQEASLAGYWRLSETSGNLLDGSTFGNHGSVSGGVTRNAASLQGGNTLNGAASFNGVDGKVVLGSSSTLCNWERTQSFSVEFLIKPNFPRVGASERIPVFSKLESTGNGRGFEISVEYASSLGKAYVRATASSLIASNRSEGRNSKSDLKNNQIYHVVVTYDGTSSPFSFDYWINGIQELESNLASGLSATILNSVVPSIGGRSDDGLFGVGTLDEISVYTAVLTPTKILDHYTAALLVPYSHLSVPSAPKVIFDTDMRDIDDIGALVIAHACHKLNECEVIACGVSSSATDGVNAVDCINTWYGRGDLPIGRFTGTPALLDTNIAWVAFLKDNCLNDIGDGALAPEAVDVYRTALAAQADGSVIIIQVGFSTNVYNLLLSPADGISPLTGAELIAAKVSRIVIMGGRYNGNEQSTAEFNFSTDKARIAALVAGWPTSIPMCFIGFENGDVIISGATLDNNTPADNPARIAYAQAGFPNGRESWDPLAVLYAIRGKGSVLFREVPGTNVVAAATGINTWTPSVGGPHRRVCEEKIKASMETTLNNLMDAAP